VLAPPTVSTVQSSQKSEKALFGKAVQKKAPFFGAFEGLLKQLQNATGMEKQSHSKEALLATKPERPLQNPAKKPTERLQGDTKSKGLDIKPASYKLKLQESQQQTVNSETERRSSTIHNKDAEALQKKQNQLTKASADVDEAQKQQVEKKQSGTTKNSRIQLLSRGTDAEQEGPLLAVFTGAGVQNRTNRIKPENSEESQDTKTKKIEKSRDRRKERIDVEVYDLRTPAGEPKTKPTESNATQDASTKTVELTLHLKEGTEKKAEYTKISSAQSPSRSFQDLLAQELRTTMNGDIVRHASMVLKDGGEGLIRLNLKPESLGNVRIKLEMADDKVTGHILVESEEALRAFEKEIHSLEQAFKDGGFQGASLEVSVSADGRGSGSFKQGQMQQPFYSDRLVANTYNGALPELLSQNQNSSLSSGPNVSINMLA